MHGGGSPVPVSCQPGWPWPRTSPQGLKQGADKLDALIGESECKALMQNVGLFKQAGLSYQPSLMVPVEGVIGCKDKEQLRILMGMYTFDANYALLFGKKKEFERNECAASKGHPRAVESGGQVEDPDLQPR